MATDHNFKVKNGLSVGNTEVIDSSRQIYAKTGTQVGEDGQYSGYGVIGFGGITNGYNRVFGRDDTNDGLYLAAGTGNKVIVRANGSASNTFILGYDDSYGGYSSLGFGGSLQNGNNRIFAGAGTSDGMYINAATGRGIFFRVNGNGSNVFQIGSDGGLYVGASAGTLVLDQSRNLTNIGTISSGSISTSGTINGSHNQNAAYAHKLSNTNTGTSAYTEFTIESGTQELRIGTSQNYSDAQWDGSWIYAAAGDLFLKSENAHVKIYAGGSVTPKWTFHTDGSIRRGDYNGTTVIDSSRNLTNIGTLSSTVFTTSAGGTNRYNLNIGSSGETWASNSRASMHLDGSSSALIGFRHSGVNRGYIFSTGSTMEFLSYGEVHLLSNASSSYFGKLSAGVWNVSHGYQMAGTTVIDSSRNVIAASLRPSVDNAWKIRGNNGNAYLSFEHSTSSSLSDTNIKAELGSTGNFIVGDRLTNILSGYQVELKKASTSIGDGGGAGALNLRATGNFYIRHNGSDELTFNGSTITSTSAIDVTGNSIIRGNLDVDGIIDNTRNNGSVAAPNTADHTVGTRISFFDNSATSWYAMGIESNTLWFNSDTGYKWYQDAALRMHLDGANLSVTGTVTASGGNSTNWNTAYGWGNHASAGYISTSVANTYSAVQTFEGSADANWRLHLTNSSSSWDAATFQGTNEWGDGTNYGVLGGDGTQGIMLRLPHIVWNASSAEAGIRLGRSGGVSSGKWVGFGVGASNQGFISMETTRVLTFESDYSVRIPLGQFTVNDTINITKSSGDSVLLLAHGAANSNDALIQFSGSAANLATEGAELWYDNSVGDFHIATTYDHGNAAIRFHTRTAASKSTSNERFVISADGDFDFKGGDFSNVGTITSGNISVGTITSGNISVGNITTSTAGIYSDTTFAFLTTGSAAQNIRTKSVFAGTSYGDTPPAGSFNATNTYELNGTTVIDSNRRGNFISIGVHDTSDTNKNGISLYNGSAESVNPTYGIMFTGTSGSGTHGSVTGSWATYFTMNSSAGRGWIFKTQGVANVASISNTGNATFNGTLSSGAITTSGNFSMTGGYSMYLGTTSRFSSDNNGGFGINYGTTGGTAAASLTVYNNTSPTIELYRDGTVYVHKGQVWDVTTQGTGKGSIHIDPNSSTANAGGAITFGSSDHSNGTVADAGIYVRSDGSYGTRMYLSTTDSYAAGSKTAMTIDASGAVTINRNTLNIQSGLLIAGTSTIDAIRNATFANITNTNGAKIEIQGTVNGGSTRGIFMWDSSDTNWGIYMAEAGAGRSLSGGTAPASLDGRTSHHVRFRCYDTDAIRGWIFEGHSNTTKVSITSDTGDIHAIGFANTTNGYKVGGVSVVDASRNGVFERLRADGGNLIMGDEAYSASASYVGIKTSFMTGSNDYMMISGVSDPDTYVSAKDGASVNIRGGGNSSSNQLTVPDSSYMTATTSNFYVTGNVTAYYSSDESLKENIRVIDNPIDKIKQIRGVYFDWTDDYIKEQSGDGQIHIRKDDVGVIAQDVQPILDEVVTTRADGTLAVKYEKMVALCIEAIKEQDEKIQKLEELVEKLISEK